MQGLCTVQEEGPAGFRYLAHFMATQTFLTLTQPWIRIVLFCIRHPTPRRGFLSCFFLKLTSFSSVISMYANWRQAIRYKICIVSPTWKGENFLTNLDRHHGLTKRSKVMSTLAATLVLHIIGKFQSRFGSQRCSFESRPVVVFRHNTLGLPKLAWSISTSIIQQQKKNRKQSNWLEEEEEGVDCGNKRR